MSIERGIVTEVTSTSSRPISISSSYPIALVLVSSVVPKGVYGFDSPKKALEWYKENKSEDTQEQGNLIKYLSLGIDMFNLSVPTIISVVEHSDDNNTLKASFIDAVNEVKKSPSITGFKPDIVVAAYDAYDLDVNNAVINVCTALKARTFINLYASNNGDAVKKRESYSSDRATLAKCSLVIYNTQTKARENYDSSVILAFLRCFVDGSSKTGYAKSISNRALRVSGVTSPSEFYAGAVDETDPLTKKQIMSFIHHEGFLTWNYKTCAKDSIWQDARRVRIFDLAAAAVLKGIFYAVDGDITELNSAKDSLRAFMNSLVGDDVMAGFSVELDLERTTASAITDGKFYFKVDAQEMPSAELISVTFNRVDKYNNAIYKILA